MADGATNKIPEGQPWRRIELRPGWITSIKHPTRPPFVFRTERDSAGEVCIVVPFAKKEKGEPCPQICYQIDSDGRRPAIVIAAEGQEIRNWKAGKA